MCLPAGDAFIIDSKLSTSYGPFLAASDSLLPSPAGFVRDGNNRGLPPPKVMEYLINGLYDDELESSPSSGDGQGTHSVQSIDFSVL